MSSKLENLTHLKYQVALWRWIGIIPPDTYKQVMFIVGIHAYELMFLSTQLTGCLTAPTVEEVFSGLTYSLPMLCGVFRAFNCYCNFYKFIQTAELTDALNKRAEMFKEGYELIEAAIKESQLLCRFITIFFNCCVTFMQIVTVFILPGRNLLAPAWAPFIDWQHSYLSFALLNLFLYFGMTYEVTLSASVDTEPAGNIMLLTSHIKALRMRFTKIGWDETKSQEENYEEFLECVEYHKMVCEFFKELSNTLSTRLVILYVISALTQCSFAINIIFADTQASFVFVMFLFASTFQTLIPCFYGDDLNYENEKLAFAIGDCNWVDQHQQFKNDLIFLTLNAQKPMRILAGGCIPCSLTTFVDIQKLAYSIFVLFNN